MLRYTCWTVLFVAALSFGGAQGQNFISFDFPGSTLTNAVGINDNGAVVGSYNDTAGKRHGFLLQDGKFTTIELARILDP